MLCRPIETTAQTGHVGSGAQVTGYPTNQELSLVAQSPRWSYRDQDVRLAAESLSHCSLLTVGPDEM